MVVLTELTAAEVLAHARQSVGLPPTTKPWLDKAFVAALLRRAAGNECPCSRATLRVKVAEGLSKLTDLSTDALGDLIENVIEDLVVVGDLLELHDVSTADQEAKSTWVFAAPPSYIVRPASVFLTGIVPDQDDFLPPFLTARVRFDGIARTIYPQPSEDLPHELRDVGLIELSEGMWLRAPKATAAATMIDTAQRQLQSQPPSGAIRDLTLIDPMTSVRFYPKRWATPNARHSGVFVARRPQDFGSPIWCLAQLNAGQVLKILDLPPRRSRWRGSDHAWHLQLAIDAERGVPQLYRRRNTSDGARFDFFSPIPQWAQRRLIIFGTSVPRESCLFSYVVAAGEADAEEQFLRDRLWLSPTEVQGE